MPTLYEISEEYRVLEELLIELEGDISDPQVEATIDAWLAEFSENLESKVDGYCAMIREYEARAAARQEEAARFAKLAQTDGNAAKKLKERLKVHLEIIGQTKVQTDRFAVSVCKNGGKLPIEIDPLMVPDDWMTWNPTPDADRIRAALEEGQKFEFATLGERGTHLRVK